MASITYQWNPFQERIDNRVKDEVIKVSTENNRVEFVPRAAPFFSRNFELRIDGSVTPLKLGVDYVFAHNFDRFIGKYSRNVFGSVVLLKPFTNTALRASYDNIGGSFILDEIAFAETVANIVNMPRFADWGDVVDVPLEFPSDPHEQPAAQTYDYMEMMTLLRSLILAMTTNNQEASLKDLLEEHLKQPLLQAHAGSKDDLALSEVINNGQATVDDLKGNSNSLNVSVFILKEAIRQMTAGTLPLN